MLCSPLWFMLISANLLVPCLWSDNIHLIRHTKGKARHSISMIETMAAVQSHAFHLAFTTVIGLAAYQAVIALARNSEDFDTWDGVLMTGANVALLFPILAIPMIFGGLRSRRLRDLSPTLEASSAHTLTFRALSNVKGCVYEG